MRKNSWTVLLILALPLVMASCEAPSPTESTVILEPGEVFSALVNKAAEDIKSPDLVERTARFTFSPFSGHGEGYAVVEMRRREVRRSDGQMDYEFSVRNKDLPLVLPENWKSGECHVGSFSWPALADGQDAGSTVSGKDVTINGVKMHDAGHAVLFRISGRTIKNC